MLQRCKPVSGIVAAVLAALMLTACFPPAKVPVDTISYPHQQGASQDCLMVLLPGRGDKAADFADQGFVGAARKAGLKADLISADLHMGYYLDRSVRERLHHDVIVPARERGYRCIWLAGISLGGFGALGYEMKYPGEVQGIVLLAPYLGSDSLLSEIREAGGIRAWQPGAIEAEDYERMLWAWIKEYGRKGGGAPPIILAYGTGDRFAPANALLADALAPGCVITTTGGHSWRTWRELWEAVLPRINAGLKGR